MTNSDLVRRTDCDGVAVVMLNAPESINALSEAMLEALSDEFDRISEDRSVKAVILRSAGKRRGSPSLRGRDYRSAPTNEVDHSELPISSGSGGLVRPEIWAAFVGERGLSGW